jgi:hypothetical protein
VDHKGTSEGKRGFPHDPVAKRRCAQWLKSIKRENAVPLVRNTRRGRSGRQRTARAEKRAINAGPTNPGDDDDS